MGIGRRQFISALGGVSLAWPLTARAQQTTIPVIGFLALASHDTFGYALGSFRSGLGESGYVEGKNVAIEYRWADNQIDRLPGLAGELVAKQVALIAAVGGLAAARAAKAATTSIPIVFTLGGDPVSLGLVASLNRPGGNATGMSLFSADLLTKRLQIARDLIPGVALVAALMNPASPEYDSDLKKFKEAARGIGQQILVLNAASADDFPAAFKTLVEQRAGALVVMTDVLFNSRRNDLVALATRYAVPTIYFQREAVEAGGLMSYGASIPDMYIHIGGYAGRILKGEKPVDLPVLQPTQIELAINLKTAKELGISIPLPLLGRADQVIE